MVINYRVKNNYAKLPSLFLFILLLKSNVFSCYNIYIGNIKLINGHFFSLIVLKGPFLLKKISLLEGVKKLPTNHVKQYNLQQS